MRLTNMCILSTCLYILLALVLNVDSAPLTSASLSVPNNVSTTSPKSKVSPADVSPLWDETSDWSFLVDQGFKVLARNVGELRQDSIYMKEQFEQLIHDNQREIDMMKARIIDMADDIAALKQLLTVSQPEIQSRCPKNWTERFNMCFRFTRCTMDKCTANGMKAACEQNGYGRLATVHSAAEEEFVLSLADEDIEGIYIGRRIEDGERVWPDGSDVDFTNLDNDENVMNSHCYMVLTRPETSRTPTWVPVRCDVENSGQTGYVCEQPVPSLAFWRL